MYQYEALVTNIVDGDTIDCIVDLGFSISMKARFRLAKINAPERFTEEGIQAKAALYTKIMGKTVTVLSHGKDKYGRWLGTFILDGEEINQWLLDNGFAVPYVD
ncbi:MAG TPA: thermonuclease family protein [Pseudoneobacillus sp.]|jgi:micrococcal nuclease|nr:thermonuclease family protein [Pseudoneobacillus sp.]